MAGSHSVFDVRQRSLLTRSLGSNEKEVKVRNWLCAQVRFLLKTGKTKESETKVAEAQGAIKVVAERACDKGFKEAKMQVLEVRNGQGADDKALQPCPNNEGGLEMDIDRICSIEKEILIMKQSILDLREDARAEAAAREGTTGRLQVSFYDALSDYDAKLNKRISDISTIATNLVREALNDYDAELEEKIGETVKDLNEIVDANIGRFEELRQSVAAAIEGNEIVEVITNAVTNAVVKAVMPTVDGRIDQKLVPFLPALAHMADEKGRTLQT